MPKNTGRYTKAGFPEFVVSKMSEPPSETTQDRTQRTDIKIPDSARNRTRAGSPHHATGRTYLFITN